MALRHNVRFRRYFVGRIATNAGDSLYLIAGMWLVYDLTGSSAYTGLAGMLLTLPAVLSVFVGPLVDRWPVRRTLVASQAIQAGVILLVPVAALTGHLSAALVLAVIPVLSLVNRFVYPTLDAALPRIVDDEDLMAANSAFAATSTGVDSVFNALGGLVIAAVGAVGLFVLDSVLFAVALLAFAAVRVPPVRSRPAEGESPDAPPAMAADGGDDGDDAMPAPGRGVVADYLADLREGIDYLRGTALLKIYLTPVVGIASFWVVLTTLPAFADGRGGPAFYGLVMAAIAAGMLVGMLLAPRLQGVPLGWLHAGLGLPAAATWFLGVSVASVPLALGLLAASTVVIGVNSVVVPTLRQLVVPDHLLGRTSTVATSAVALAMPAGAAIGGAVGETFGPEVAVAALGVGHLVVAGIFLLDGELRGLPSVEAATAADLRLPTVADSVEN